MHNVSVRLSPDKLHLGLLAQSEDGQCVGRADEHLATAHRWRDELVARPKLVAAAGGLVAVVEFMRKVRCIVRMQYGGVRVFMSPHNGIRRTIRRNHRGGTGVGKGSGRLRGWSRRELRIRDAERFQGAAGVAIVDVSVEPRRRAADAAAPGCSTLPGNTPSTSCQMLFCVALNLPMLSRSTR